MTGYGGTPGSSTTDEVRFWIQDTDSTDYEFTDTEITYLLAQFPSSPILAARYGCQILATKYARQPDYSMGGVISESASSISKMYSDRANDLIKIYNESLSGTSISVPTAITRVKDAIPENYPSKSKYTDIELQGYGNETD
jgi:hypothetical protein